MHTVSLDIAINGAFTTRRWEEPRNFMRLTREMGYRYHEFCADVLDPFFSGDREYQLKTAREIRRAAAEYGVQITDVYTGVATHRFHGLSHSDEACRRRMREWIERMMNLALEMGTDRIGGHWDALSVEILEDPERTEAAWRNIVQQFREISALGKKKGLAAVYDEQMYTPSEVPWTLEQAERFLTEVNQDSEGVPIYLTIDTGHQAGQQYGLAAPDTDYREWLRRFGAFAEIVHVQQTTPEASAHWPFTPKYNEQGHVSVPDVLESLNKSHEQAAGTALARCLPPVSRTYLVAEIIPSSTKNEKTIIAELSETARFLRQFIPEGGLTWTFEE
jgi:sugar phosphate isomerase/epimerase